jgi:exodeoxyribonuclease III
MTRTLQVILFALVVAFTAQAAPLRILSYNVWVGFNRGESTDKGVDWIKDQKPDVVALQELVGVKQTGLVTLGERWGHPHAEILRDEGYPVGITSRTPIKVIERRTEKMHHGYLHVETAGVQFFVVHLSPFRYRMRNHEAKIICEALDPLLKSGEPVIVLGDFNAVSPLDAEALSTKTALLERMSKSDAGNAKLENLRDGAFDFNVLQQFYDGGLVDQCYERLHMRPDFKGTFPSRIFDPEQPWAVYEAQLRRIDYVLMDPATAKRATQVEIVRDGVVNEISDHYPIVVEMASAE